MMCFLDVKTDANRNPIPCNLLEALISLTFDSPVECRSVRSFLIRRTLLFHVASYSHWLSGHRRTTQCTMPTEKNLIISSYLLNFSFTFHKKKFLMSHIRSGSKEKNNNNWLLQQCSAKHKTSTSQRTCSMIKIYIINTKCAVGIATNVMFARQYRIHIVQTRTVGPRRSLEICVIGCNFRVHICRTKCLCRWIKILINM